jgi:hypothetical protein
MSTFSNARIDSNPGERMIACSFADNFLSLATIAANDGSAGANALADHGLSSNGATGYVAYPVLAQPGSFSVKIQLKSTATTPQTGIFYNAILRTGALLNGFDIWLDADGVKANHCNGITLPTACEVDFNYADGAIHTITYVVDMSNGIHKLYVDALDVNSQSTTINQKIGTTNPIFITPIVDVCTLYKARIFDGLLTEADHDVYHSGKEVSFLIDDVTATYRCDDFCNDSDGHKIWDRTVEGNHLYKADRVSTTKFPTFATDKYVFDGVDDYISNAPTRPTLHTISNAVYGGWGGADIDVDENGIFAAWYMKNNNGIIDDLIGSIDATIVNTVDVETNLGDAQNGNGTTSYLQVDMSSMVGFTSMTIALWFKPTSLTTLDEIVGFNTVRCSFASDEPQFTIATSSGTIALDSNFNLTPGIWYFLVYTYDGTNMKIFVNADEKSSVGQTGTINTPGSNSSLMARGNGSYDRNIDGLVSNIQIFNIDKGSDWISEQYRAGYQALNNPYPVVQQNNDDTFLSTIETEGGFEGYLHSMIIQPSVLSQVQLKHDEYQHLYWLQRGNAQGAYHRLITEETCKLAVFMDATANKYSDFSKNLITGTPTNVTEGGSSGVTFPTTQADVIVDGDMEAAGVTAWTVGGSALLTKETSSPYEGTQWLKVAYNGVNYPFTSQSILTIGKKYTLSGVYKGDGTNGQPRILNYNKLLITGSTSTSWQAFEITFEAVHAELRFYNNWTASSFAGYDALQVIEHGSNITFTDEAGIRVKEGTISVQGTFTGSVAAGTLFAKGTKRELKTNGNQIDFGGSTIAHTFSNNRQIAVTFKDGYKPRFYVDGQYIGEGSAVWTYNLLVDGNCNDSGVTAWTVGGSATLTKETTSPVAYEGSRWLKAAYNGTSNPYAQQFITTIGENYELMGVINGDGTYKPFVWWDTGPSRITGTISTSWQKVDTIYTATRTDLRFYSEATAAGHAGFDDFSVDHLTDLIIGNNDALTSPTQYALKKVYLGDYPLTDKEINALFEESLLS